MKLQVAFVVSLMLLTLNTEAVAQTSGSELQLIVKQLQLNLKPTVGRKPALFIRDNPANNMSGDPIPLFLNGHWATLDSLANYSLTDLEELRVDKSIRATEQFGTAGSWGVIHIVLKNKR